MKHLWNVLAHACVAILAVLLVGPLAGVVFHSSVFAAILSAAVLGSIVLPLGVGTLIMARMKLGLAQSGRLIQMGLFWGLNTLALAGFAWLLPSVITVNSAMLGGFSILLAFVVLSFVTGNLGSFRNRSWLPVRMKDMNKGN